MREIDDEPDDGCPSVPTMDDLWEWRGRKIRQLVNVVHAIVRLGCEYYGTTEEHIYQLLVAGADAPGKENGDE